MMKLIFSIGAPNSGKTTFLQKLYTETKGCYISPDLLIHGKWTYEKADLAWRECYHQLYIAIKDCIPYIYFDAMLLTPRDRTPIIQAALTNNYEIICHVFNIPLIILMERNYEKNIPSEVIVRTHNNLVFPKKDIENIDKIIVHTLSFINDRELIHEYP